MGPTRRSSSARGLAAALAVSLALVSTAHAAKPGPLLCVGLGTPTTCGIVKDGVVQAGFEPLAVEGTSAQHFTVGASRDAVVLFVSATEALTTPVALALSVDKSTAPKVTSNFTGTEVSASGVRRAGTTQKSLAAGAVGRLAITFNCKERSDDTRVVVVVADRASGTAVRFALHKACDGAQTSMDTVKAGGVDIATRAGLRSTYINNADVVADGAAKPAYVLGSKADLADLRVIPASEMFTSFFVAANPNATDEVVIGPVSVLAESSAARPRVSGPASRSNVHLPFSGVFSTLTVTHNCRSTGRTPITVRVPVIKPDAGAITFSFIKECAVTESDASSVKQAMRAKGVVPGLSAETSNTFAPIPIARDGVALPEWTEQGAADDGVIKEGFVKYDEDTEDGLTPGVNTVSAGRDALSFALFMKSESPGAAERVAVDAPLVFVEDGAVVAARIDEDIREVTSKHAELRLKFRCLSVGVSKVSVAIPLVPPTTELKFTVIKVCDPEPEAASASRAAQAADDDSAKRVPVDISLSAKLSEAHTPAFAIVVDGTTQADYLARAIATKHAPQGVAALEAVRTATGVSQTCINCLPSPDTYLDAAGVRAALVGCNVTQACKYREYLRASESLQKVVAASYAEASGPSVIAKGVFSLDTYLRSHEGGAPLSVGNAEVVSFDEAVCVPKLAGPGAIASTLNADGKDRARRLTVTFNCVGHGGTALVMVVVPVYGRSSGAVTFAVLKQCAEVDATEFGGDASDNAEMANELENVVSHAGVGVNVGRGRSDAGATDVVDNGLVLPEWLPTSTVENRDAGGFTLGDENRTLSLFFSGADGVDAEPASVGVPQAVSFNPRVCKVSVAPSSDMHASKAMRGRFTLDEALELGLSFDCLSEGTAVIAVAVPLGPRAGGLQLEFAKVCGPDERYRPYTGEVIKGLAVGTAAGDADVVRDGQTARFWSRYKRSLGPGDRRMIDSYTQSLDFFLHTTTANVSAGMPFAAPIVVAHKPVCSPTIEGPAAGGGTVTKSPLKLTVKFNCVWDGTTQVTVFVPLPGLRENGHIVWTLTKRCKGRASDVRTDVDVPLNDMTLRDMDGDGILAPLHEEWMPWRTDMDYNDAQDYYYDQDYSPYGSNAPSYSEWNQDWEPEDWDAKLDRDEYWWYGEDDYASMDSASYYQDDTYAQYMVDPWAYDYDAEDDDGAGFDGDALVDALATRGWESGRLSVGTHFGTADVVADGVALDRYKLCEPLPGLPCPIMAMVAADTANFTITSSGVETIKMPQAFAKYPRSVTASVDNAAALDGREIVPGESVEIHIRLQCNKMGATSPVLVSVPYGPYHVDFSFVKVCGKSFSPAVVAIEMTTVLVGAGVVVSMILSFFAGAKLKKMRDGRDLMD